MTECEEKYLVQFLGSALKGQVVLFTLSPFPDGRNANVISDKSNHSNSHFLGILPRFLCPEYPTYFPIKSFPFLLDILMSLQQPKNYIILESVKYILEKKDEMTANVPPKVL